MKILETICRALIHAPIVVIALVAGRMVPIQSDRPIDIAPPAVSEVASYPSLTAHLQSFAEPNPRFTPRFFVIDSNVPTSNTGRVAFHDTDASVLLAVFSPALDWVRDPEFVLTRPVGRNAGRKLNISAESHPFNGGVRPDTF